MDASSYVHRLTGKVFKLLPMKDEELLGENVYLNVYLGSLRKEIAGAMQTFPVLADDFDYVTVANTANYIAENAIAPADFSREVRKMLRLLNNVEARGDRDA